MRKERGITLIALIITIILLLILAGVVISLALGENGLFTTAKYATKQYGEEAIKEKVVLIIGDYSTNKYANDKDLKDFLEEQKTAGKIDDIEDDEDNEEGTIAIIVDDYRFVIDEETLEILEMGKMGPRPKISNIKMTYTDTDGLEKEVAEKSVIEGTPIKITFDVTFEEGTIEGVNKGTLENAKVEYTTDGTELEVIFVVTGKIGEEEYPKIKKVLLENLYRQPYIAEVVKVGDFVNYTAGVWSQSDIDYLENYCDYSAPLVGEVPNLKAGAFGGFKLGESKDASINGSNSNNIFSRRLESILD